MFDVGFSELLLIAVVALLVLGPQRLPEVARAAGRWMARLRRFVEDVKRDVARETGDQDLAALRQIHREISDTRGLLEKSAADAFAALNEIKTSATEPSPPATLAPLTPPAAPRRRPKTRPPTARKKHGKKTRTRRR